MVGDRRGGGRGELTETHHRPGGAARASQSISAEMKSSASTGRSGRAATDPKPQRTRRLSVSTTSAQHASEMTMALRVPTLRNCWGPWTRATRTARMTSPAAIAVRFGPVMNSCSGSVRSPPRPARTTSASRAASSGSVSPAGLAVPTLPPIVPALRICGEPTVRAAAARAGNSPARSVSIWR